MSIREARLYSWYKVGLYSYHLPSWCYHTSIVHRVANLYNAKDNYSAKTPSSLLKNEKRTLQMRGIHCSMVSVNYRSFNKQTFGAHFPHLCTPWYMQYDWAALVMQIFTTTFSNVSRKQVTSDISILLSTLLPHVIATWKQLRMDCADLLCASVIGEPVQPGRWECKQTPVFG